MSNHPYDIDMDGLKEAAELAAQQIEISLKVTIPLSGVSAVYLQFLAVGVGESLFDWSYEGLNVDSSETAGERFGEVSGASEKPDFVKTDDRRVLEWNHVYLRGDIGSDLRLSIRLSSYDALAIKRDVF